MQEGDDLAHEAAEDEVLQYRPDKGKGHAEHATEQVGDAEVQQVDVGDGAHLGVSDERHYHQNVTEHAEEQDQRVEADLQPPVGPDVTELGILVRSHLPRRGDGRHRRQRVQSAGVQHAGVGHSVQSAGVGHGVQSTGVGHGVQHAGIGHVGALADGDGAPPVAPADFRAGPADFRAAPADFGASFADFSWCSDVRAQLPTSGRPQPTDVYNDRTSCS